jgi:hypothetical protein
MSTWPDGPGVVELPDGRRIRARGLRSPLPVGPEPQLGVYLLGHEPEPTAWEQRWIRWPDFRLPASTDAALAVLAGVPASDAVEWVRRHHHRRAVETPWQRRWVRRLSSPEAGGRS